MTTENQRPFETTVQALAVCIQTRTPVLLIGEVGVGKTSIVNAALRRYTTDQHTALVALYDPTDFKGIFVPQMEQGVARSIPLEWVHRLSRAERAGVFLDELGNGAPATRTAALRGVLEGTWGEAKIAHQACVGAMNPPAMSETGYQLSGQLSSRFVQLDWNLDPETWGAALVGGFPDPEFGPPLPADWERHRARYDALIAAFAVRQPTSVQGVPTEAAARAKPFPTYRAWTSASSLLSACHALGQGLLVDEGRTAPASPSALAMLLLAGRVGSGPAMAFAGYVREMNLPDPEDLIRSPSSLRLQGMRGDQALVTLNSVAGAILRHNTADRWHAGWKVLKVAVEQERIDVAAQAAMLLSRNQPKGAQTPVEALAFQPLLAATDPQFARAVKGRA